MLKHFPTILYMSNNYENMYSERTSKNKIKKFGPDYASKSAPII